MSSGDPTKKKANKHTNRQISHDLCPPPPAEVKRLRECYTTHGVTARMYTDVDGRGKRQRKHALVDIANEHGPVACRNGRSSRWQTAPGPLQGQSCHRQTVPWRCCATCHSARQRRNDRRTLHSNALQHKRCLIYAFITTHLAWTGVFIIISSIFVPIFVLYIVHFIHLL